MDSLREVTDILNIRLSDDETYCIAVDQTKLPGELCYVDLHTAEDYYTAIKLLQVRGAPCIGITAGYAMYCLAQTLPTDKEAFLAEYERLSAYINSSRPTAVNLSWALRRMRAALDTAPEADTAEWVALLGKEAKAIHEEDMAMCRAISEYGLSLLKEGDGVLTHCNAGPLATSRLGTAQGPMFLAKEKGINLRVFADETRPLLQGARLTAYEMHKAGIDVTLICDNMASIVMKNGWVDMVFFGCDRIAANGDVANKIGSSGVAILAKHYGIPVYSLGPTSTIDLDCPTGDDIKIELRDEDEIRSLWYEKPMAPTDVKCYNPAFDVTDHSLLTGIITENGIAYPPFTESLRKMCGKDK